MFRSIDVLMVGLLIAVVAWTFKVKHDTQVTTERIAEMERRIAAEKIEIDLLKSDWSLLTNPARLQTLVDRHQEELAIEPMAPEQLASPDELPGYRHETPATGSPLFNDYTEADTAVTTGSIEVPTPRPKP